MSTSIENGNGNGTAIRKQPEIITTLSSDLFKKQVALALPRHMTPDRFARVALTAMRKTPKLMDCTPESVISCMMSLSQYGLEPDGRRAHLIPYGRECTLILDYKGLAELALRSGLVSTLHADVVNEGDIFKYSMGEITEHVPHFLRRDADKPDSPGQVYAVYAMCKNKDGTTKCEVMSIAEVNAIQRRSKASGSGPWKTDWSEMAKKTAFRRLSKWLVLSPEFRDAAEADEEREVIETTVNRIANQPQRLSDLVDDVGSDHEPGDDDHETDPVSQLSFCVQHMKAEGIECTDSDPEGTRLEYTLPGGKVLTLGDGVTGEGSIDTREADALDQVVNEIAADRKKR